METVTGTAGTVLTGGSIVSGFAQWVSQYANLVSMSMTVLSCIGGLVFLYLNYRQNVRRNDIEQLNVNAAIRRRTDTA